MANDQESTWVPEELGARGLVVFRARIPGNPAGEIVAVLEDVELDDDDDDQLTPGIYVRDGMSGPTIGGECGVTWLPSETVEQIAAVLAQAAQALREHPAYPRNSDG